MKWCRDILTLEEKMGFVIDWLLLGKRAARKISVWLRLLISHPQSNHNFSPAEKRGLNPSICRVLPNTDLVENWNRISFDVQFVDGKSTEIFPVEGRSGASIGVLPS